MLELLIVGGVAAGTSLFGFIRSRRFVRERLRFVDAVQRPSAPVLAGILAAVVAGPVVWLLPFLGTGTAILFGVGVAAGVSAGAKDTRRLPSG